VPIKRQVVIRAHVNEGAYHRLRLNEYRLKDYADTQYIYIIVAILPYVLSPPGMPLV